MPLARESELLRDAWKNRYAVAAFNVFNLESISWIIKAAEAENAPVIAMLYPACKTHIPAGTFVKIARDLAERSKAPVGVHYDHSGSFEEIMSGIADGFPSVMIDGSSLAFVENVTITKDVVRVAHPMGVDVEAELGRVGRASDPGDFTDAGLYTDPESAAEFVERTGVDSLAVAVGSAHGNYVVAPRLDTDRLEELKEAVSVPLVLHGGSGIPDDQVKAAVKRGIAKLNIGTEFGQEFYARQKDIMVGNRCPATILACLGMLEKEMVGYVRGKIRLLMG